MEYKSAFVKDPYTQQVNDLLQEKGILPVTNTLG